MVSPRERFGAALLRQCRKTVAVPRAWLRARFFRLMRAALESDDGRAIAVDALRDVLRWRPEVAPRQPESIEPPYPELPPSAAADDSRQREAVFITGRFRSGSTLLWNLFRNAPNVTAYYEPLNERRWFDPRTRGDRVDGTHRFVDDYWREYDGLEELADYYRESWIGRNLYMDADSWDPALERYIATLIERADGRPVLQFNRVDFRLPWLRRHFPRARIIHLYRHPRDQWCSTLADVRCFSKDGRMQDFAPHDRFYLRLWANDLRHHFPFVDERTVRHPYQLFYYVWKLSYLFGRWYADYSVAFEEVLADPAGRIAELFQAADVDDYDEEKLLGLIKGPEPAKWKAYADDDWFRRQEDECESVIDEFIGRPERAENSVPTLLRTPPTFVAVRNDELAPVSKDFTTSPWGH
jgi:hypothetical protein